MALTVNRSISTDPSIVADGLLDGATVPETIKIGDIYSLDSALPSAQGVIITGIIYTPFLGVNLVYKPA